MPTMQIKTADYSLKRNKIYKLKIVVKLKNKIPKSATTHTRDLWLEKNSLRFSFPT